MIASRWLEGLLCCILSLVGFALTCVTLGQFRPSATECSVPTYSAKCRKIQQEGEPIDIVVVGTSRMFNGVIPDEVEAELERQGARARVWNLSLHNLASFEQKRILRDVFVDLGLAPRLVIIEPCSRLGVGLANVTSTRRTYFFDSEGASNAWKFTLASNRSVVRKTYNLACLIPNSAVGLMNYGLFAETAFPDKAAVKSRRSEEASFLRTRGFESSAAEVDGVVKIAADLTGQAEAAQMQEHVERHRSELLPQGQADAIRDAYEWVTSQGSKCAFVVMPKFAIPDSYYRRTEFQLSRTLEANSKLVSIDYLSRKQHPELYEPSLWHDYNHLSDSGAKLFSRKLADRIAPLLRGGE